MPESGWVTLERYIEVINVILAVGFPIYIPSYSPATPETKLGETKLLLIVVFEALVHILPFIFNGNINAIC
jgi:hypothetical protein